MIKSIAFVSVLILSLNTYSQEGAIQVVPGDDIINGEFIEEYTNRWKVSLVDAAGNKTPNKVWTDYGQIMELDGKKYFHRVQDLYDPNMNLLDTWIIMVEHKTLIPISYTSIKPSGNFTYLQFDGDQVTGNSNQNEENNIQKINSELSQNVFDWNMYGMLLVGLPLKEGLQFKLPFYASQTGDLLWLNVNVIEQETIEQLDGKKIKTWKVETDKRLTFWLTKSAPYVIKLEVELQNNSKLLWEVF